MSLRRETFRLSRAFGALVLAVTPIAAAEACGDASRTTDLPGSDADATTPIDASDAPDDTGRAPFDATCQIEVEIIDAGPDVDPPCRYRLPCGLPEETAFVVRGCGFYRSEPDEAGDASLGCQISESDGCKNGVYSPPANGSLSFECLDCLNGSGRRPRGLRRAARVQAPCEAGAYFARMAHDEAASVHAFARMHSELLALSAPTALVRAAARSMHDETRHARLMSRQARRLGARPPAARVRSPRARSLESLARENATEGCIRETYGALVMRWQATHASDPSLRRLFARIATDETRHAALSWEVAQWAEQRLDARARARVSAARRRALRALGESVRARAARELDTHLGQPNRTAAVALLDGLIAHLAMA